MIGFSVEPGWLHQIPVIARYRGRRRDCNYLSEKEAIALYSKITEKFPSGQFIFMLIACR